jgi:hypothetical protein
MQKEQNNKGKSINQWCRKQKGKKEDPRKSRTKEIKQTE